MEQYKITNSDIISGLKKFILLGIITFTFFHALAYFTHKDNIYVKVAKDCEIQYNITLKSGTKIDQYVHAGLCSAAWLQAQDETNYKKWKQIENKLAEELNLQIK